MELTKKQSPSILTPEKASITFVVRIEALIPNIDKISFSFRIQNLRDPPAGPGDFRPGKSTFLRWTNGIMDAISKSDSAILSLRGKPSGSSMYSVASVITQPEEKTYLWWISMQDDN